MPEKNEINEAPFIIRAPKDRWYPRPEQVDLFEGAIEKVIPPLVHKIRVAVAEWRDAGYPEISETTRALLEYWFEREHFIGEKQFRFYFAQREAIESIIYLYEVCKARDKFDLMRFSSSERISAGMFDEDWTRYVIKMATGTGKTMVLGLALIWSYFHKKYEEDSPLSMNFVIISPNIIVLNRLEKDYDCNYPSLFREFPFIPPNGFKDRNWEQDFQMTYHYQDEVKPITTDGNLFLTNIHRVFLTEEKPSRREEFLGRTPSPDADTSKGIDLGKILRSGKLKDLVVMNDEAHHIHDSSLEWFKSIQDINNNMLLRHNRKLSLQVDFTATPKHNNGDIFVQTITDYPLVEAINHGVVKTPVLPDEASRAKVRERQSKKCVDKYRDFIDLGYIEWEKQYKDLQKHRTPILFVMTPDTRDADEVAAYLEKNYSLLKGRVLVIHTNKSGEVKERASSKRAKKELEDLRNAANDVDSEDSPFRAVVSVMMLREGWDVKNVSTIVGIRQFSAPSNILPEQTIGRGIRKMFGLEVKEELTVLGTTAFIQFVESLKTEGVTFEYKSVGRGAPSRSPLIIEVDRENEKKDIDKLDIQLPILTRKVYREYKNLDLINIHKMEFEPVKLKQHKPDELKEIVFVDLDGKESHRTLFEASRPDWRGVIGFFTDSILRESRLFSGFNVLYPKVELFIRDLLFGESVDLEDANVIRNLSDAKTKDTIFRAFKTAIDKLTVTQRGSAKIRNFINLKNARSKVVSNQEYTVPEKSVFNKMVYDSGFEAEFAAFIDNLPDIISWGYNTRGENGINFKIEYQSSDSNIRDYFPDFFVKVAEDEVYIIETKGIEDPNAVLKRNRLRQWCKDINEESERKFYSLFVPQTEWNKRFNDIRSFRDIIDLFKVES